MKRLLLFFICFLSLVYSIRTSAEDTYNNKPEFKISYMGTIEAGHVFPWSHFLRVTHGMVTLTTAHGVQIKPWLFTGLGVGALMNYHKDRLGLWFPIFLNGRLTLPKKHFRPFFDFKLGFIPSQYIFINPSIGYKFAWGKKGGVRLFLGAYIFPYRHFHKFNGISANLGFDF